MGSTKTKFDCEIESFEAAFADKKELKIALYGTGRMTATLLGHAGDFHIIGLLDRDTSMIGKEMYGVKIMGREEAEKEADIIVINTTETYWATIYQRICMWEIPIYFRNGKRATEEFLHIDKGQSYWKKNYAELEKKVMEYEVVSFDIFDTLLMRKVYLPVDIFFIVEKIFRKKLGEKFSFVEPRKKAASLLNNANIDEIYVQMKEAEGWNSELTESIKLCEIEVEKQLIVQRRDMIELCNSIKKIKEVFLVSDMYFPRTFLKQILMECGIEISEDKILVSCDYKKSKEEGTLWEYYANEFVSGKKALHIGDNERLDGEIPTQYGIDSYLIWSANKIFQESSIGNVAHDINTLCASIFYGMLGSKLFNSPFALHKTCGKLLFNNEQEAGYCLLGSIVYVFCDWLVKRATDNNDKQLAFFAREGYLLTELFEYYCKLKRIKDKPEVIYMETSRRAVLVTSIQNMEDIYEAAAFPYIGNIKEFLKDRFGLLCEDESLQKIDCVYTDENKQRLQNMLMKYEKEIMSEAKEERKNYCEYLNSIKLSSDFAVIDSQLYGTTQYYLSKLLGKKLKGYYFCVCLDKTNKYLERNNMEGCFPSREDLDGKDSSIYKNSAFIEAFFTAPNGMLEYIDGDGRKKYAPKKQNQINFDVRFDMVEGIRDFMSEIENIFSKYQIKISSEDIYFVDRVFGEMMNNGFEATDRMKKSFYYDNGILSSREMPIWE